LILVLSLTLATNPHRLKLRYCLFGTSSRLAEMAPSMPMV
jgi:hypothetical protein